MTYQTIYGLEIPKAMGGIPSLGNTTIDADGEKTAFIFNAPVTDTLTKVGFFTKTVTTGGDLDIRIETVDSSGFPTGTLWGTNTNVTQTINATDDNTWFEVTLTAGASLTAGDIFAVVITRSSGTFAGQIHYSTGSEFDKLGFPTLSTYTTSWASFTAAGIVAALYFSTNGYYPMEGIHGVGSTNYLATYNNTSTPDVIGNVINIPYAAKASGIWVVADFDGPAVIKLYDSDGVTVLAAVTNDDNTPVTATGTLNYRLFTAEVALSANTDYRIAVEPSSATNLSFYYREYASAAIRAQDTHGVRGFYTSAKDPTGTGDWTDDTTRIAAVGLLISAIDFPTGGGGGTTGSSYTWIA